MASPKLELTIGIKKSGVLIGNRIYTTNTINKNISKGDTDFKKSNFMIIIYSGRIFL